MNVCQFLIRNRAPPLLLLFYFVVFFDLQKGDLFIGLIKLNNQSLLKVLEVVLFMKTLQYYCFV